MNNKSRHLRAVSRGFTLIELMVVAAVIVILAAIALPAYNNYTLKSKFTEVVVAAGPTKTAISACAVAGDCVSGNSISLATTGGTGTTGTTTLPTFPQMTTTTTTVHGVTTTTTTPLQSTPAEVWALIVGAFVYGGSQASDGYPAANANATGWANTPGWYIAPDPNNPGTVCEVSVDSGGQCLSYNVPISIMAQYYNPTINPKWSARDTAMQASGQWALPCVAGPNCTPSTKYVSSVSYTITGIVTATATSASGLNGETFVLVPQYSGGRVDWIVSGSCKTRAGGALC